MLIMRKVLKSTPADFDKFNHTLNDDSDACDVLCTRQQVIFYVRLMATLTIPNNRYHAYDDDSDDCDFLCGQIMQYVFFYGNEFKKSHDQGYIWMYLGRSRFDKLLNL